MKKILFPTLMVLLLSGLSFAQHTATADSDFFSTDQVHSLKLTFNQEDWPYLLDSLRIQGDGYLLANIQIDGKLYENVGVRYRGSKSFRTGSKRNAFNIKLNYINKNQNHQGYEKIKLSNALRDPSLLREVMGYEIAGNYLPTPKAGYINLAINKNNYGLFIAIEPVDKVFLKKHYGDADGSLFKAASTLPDKMSKNCKNKIYAALEYEKDISCYMGNFEMDSETGWDDLIELTDVLNNRTQNLEKVLNVDRTLWMLAFNNALANLSSYSGQNSQNFYLYKDQYGQFNPIIWDLNLAFGSFKNTGVGSDLDLKGLQMMDPLLHVDNTTKPLISQLFKSEEYKKIYLDHIRTIIYDHFVNGEYEARAQELQKMIRASFNNDPNKFYTTAEFDGSLTQTTGKRSKIPGIVELMSKRARFLKKHPELAIFPPEIDEVKLTRREKFSTKEIKDFQFVVTVKNRANRVKLFYRQNSKKTYQSVYLADDGKHNDQEAGDKVFGITVTPAKGQDTLEYYFQTENAKASGFYPRNYMYEPGTISLKELNK